MLFYPILRIVVVSCSTLWDSFSVHSRVLFGSVSFHWDCIVDKLHVGLMVLNLKEKMCKFR